MVKNKKRKKPLPKKKLAKKPVSLSRLFNVHTRANRRKISAFKRIVTKQRIYISMAGLVLIIIASTAVYAVNNKINLNSHGTKSTPTTETTTSDDSQSSSGTGLDGSPSINTTEQSTTPTCHQIDVAAEARLLKSTSALTYPHYGDSHSVFDAYNNGYRQAYNTYLSTVRQQNCPITITDRGTVQYAAPTCTQAYADKIVVVLRNNIISGVNWDMEKYNEWYIAGLSKTSQQIAGEQNIIQSQNDGHVRGYVSDANSDLSKIYCPSLNPANFYTHMF
jgi:hypothetical protein